MSATAVNERLAALTAAGTSVWLDQLSRGLIDLGRAGADGRAGVAARRDLEPGDLREVDPRLGRLRRRTSSALADEGKSAREIYRAMALHDVRAACDVLRPVYDATDGVDGYVSWEVAPRLAHDTEGTLEQGHMYWELVDRPNLMIKIPATDAGLPAIEQALFDGLNINVTLLFSVAAYERVMEAYCRAMERRLEAGRPLDRHSVASFFVSRVDTEVDKRLEALGNTELQGTRRAGQRARRLPGVPAGVRGRALRAAARGGLPGPAAAVGLDRRQEPGLSGDAVRLGARRPEHGQHDADAGAGGRRRRGRRDRRDRGRGSVRRSAGAGRRRASTSTT